MSKNSRLRAASARNNSISASSNLRVISGRYRGRTLQSPRDERTHPMGAREKLALFNMVNVEQATVLDAFAGSGALGIEALSRGATEAVFVENNAKVAAVIKQNLQALNIDSPSGEDYSPAKTPKTVIFIEKVAKFAENPQFSQYFDVIFADPPYDKVNPEELSGLADLLKPSGTLALSSPAEQGNIELPELQLISTHIYARAQITIYRKNP